MTLSCTVSETLSRIYQNLKRSRDPKHILLRVIYHACTALVYSFVSISTRNLKCLASTITRIRLGQDLKQTGYQTLNMPFLEVVCHHRLGFDTIYLHAKFDHCSFSRFSDILGASKFKVGHVTLTTPF